MFLDDHPKTLVGREIFSMGIQKSVSAEGLANRVFL